MKSTRQTAVLVGALFLLATITFGIGSALVAPILGSPDYLAEVAGNAQRIVIAALLALTDGVAVVAIAALLFPILKRHHESVALGYLGIRIAELGAVSLYALSSLLLITLSRVGDPSAPQSHAVGAVLLGMRYWTLLFVYLFSGIAGLLLSYALFQTRLVPRILSILGLIGYAVFLVGASLDMLGYIDTAQGWGLLVLLPGGLFELLLPLWLFAKGFSSSAIQSKPADGASNQTGA